MVKRECVGLLSQQSYALLRNKVRQIVYIAMCTNRKSIMKEKKRGLKSDAKKRRGMADHRVGSRFVQLKKVLA